MELKINLFLRWTLLYRNQRPPTEESRAQPLGGFFYRLVPKRLGGDESSPLASENCVLNFPNSLRKDFQKQNVARFHVWTKAGALTWDPQSLFGDYSRRNASTRETELFRGSPLNLRICASSGAATNRPTQRREQRPVAHYKIKARYSAWKPPDKKNRDRSKYVG